MIPPNGFLPTRAYMIPNPRIKSIGSALVQIGFRFAIAGFSLAILLVALLSGKILVALIAGLLFAAVCLSSLRDPSSKSAFQGGNAFREILRGGAAGVLLSVLVFGLLEGGTGIIGHPEWHMLGAALGGTVGWIRGLVRRGEGFPTTRLILMVAMLATAGLIWWLRALLPYLLLLLVVLSVILKKRIFSRERTQPGPVPPLIHSPPQLALSHLAGTGLTAGLAMLCFLAAWNSRIDSSDFGRIITLGGSLLGGIATLLTISHLASMDRPKRPEGSGGLRIVLRLCAGLLTALAVALLIFAIYLASGGGVALVIAIYPAAAFLVTGLLAASFWIFSRKRR
jgi:hypothetical protein